MDEAGIAVDPMIGRYLQRLGVDERPAPSLAWLRRLHTAHLQSVPFENLSIHLGEPIVLEPGALVSKLVDRRRGGFCYELNGAFAALLRALGFDVSLLAARVHDGDRLGPPFDHMCLRIELDEPWLVDVGFGDNHLLPLRLEPGIDQHDPGGVFRITEAGDGALDLVRDGQPQFRFDLTPRRLAEYEETCRYHQASPASHFTRNTVCSMATTDGRVTIRDTTLIVSRNGERSERDLDTNDLLDAYRRHFGIALDHLPPQPRLPLDEQSSGCQTGSRRHGD